VTGADRDDVAALLPFLVNGTLAGDEKVRVEAAVAADPGLQGELAALRAIRTQMQAEPWPQSPGAFGEARLMRDIARDGRIPRTGWLWQAVAAAAVVLLVVQTALIWRDDGLRLAEGSAETATGPVLTVAFVPTAAEADLRALLLELDLTIVSGPSAIGLYRLSARDEAARAVALERLAASPLVESVEAAE
jgi:anti-sigma factor RsiW